MEVDDEQCLLGGLLLRSLVKALIMKEEHTAVNEKFDAMFSDELRDKWMGMIRDWERDKTKPNPFTHIEKGKHAYTVCALWCSCLLSR